MKKIALKEEPVLRTHRWIVVIVVGRNSRYHYCDTLKEVTREIKCASFGSKIHVFKAVHNFVEAWQK